MTKRHTANSRVRRAAKTGKKHQNVSVNIPFVQKSTAMATAMMVAYFGRVMDNMVGSVYNGGPHSSYVAPVPEYFTPVAAPTRS